jgi:repressor of nif and glnA expression
MEEKTAKDIVSQLKRIADALEKKNGLTEAEQKRRFKLEKLEEKKLKLDIRESVDPEKNVRVAPRLNREG